MQKIALLFPGQGSQFLGMGKSLYENFAVARQVFEEANDILGFDIAKVCFNGSFTELNRNKNMLPAIFINSVAAYKVFMTEIECYPTVCAGHSLGEYSALTCSGVLSYSDTLKLVRDRSYWAKEISCQRNGVMTVMEHIDKQILDKICSDISTGDKPVQIACYNSADQFVISGTRESVEKAEVRAVNSGANIIPLFDSPSFHCEIMEPLVEKIKKVLNKVTMGSFRWPVYSSVTGKHYKDINEVTTNLSAQVANPVLWYDIARYMETRDNIELYVEMGSQNTLSVLLKRSFPKANTFSLTRSKDINKISNYIHRKTGSKEIWDYHIIVNLCFKYAVSLQNYNINSRAFLQGKAVAKYQSLQKEIIYLNNNQKQLDQTHAYQALEMLRAILIEKGLSKNEKKETINDLLFEVSQYKGITHMIQQVMKDLL